jgi:hypothetical protein
MKRPEFRPFAREDFPDAPWIERLIRPLNTVLGAVTAGLGNGLTLGENLNAEIRTLDITTRDEWTALTLMNGATAGALAVPGYRYEAGAVRLRGEITSLPGADIVFASGYPKPTHRQWLTGGGYNGTTAFGLRIGISTDGLSSYEQQSGVTYLSLDGLTYPFEGHAPANPAFPVRFTTKVKGRVAGVLVLRCVELQGRNELPVNDSLSVGWSADGGNVQLNSVAGLAGGKTYRLTLAVLGG